MKKRIISVLAVSAFVLAGCGNKPDKASDAPVVPDATSSVSQQNENDNTDEGSEDTDALPDQQTPTDEDGYSADTEPTVAGETDSADTENEQAQPDPFGNGDFEYDAYGAVVFNQDYTTLDDSVLISAAQALFRSACNTNWSYFVGCPYSIDTESYVENEFGWQYYLINDGVTSSLADVKSDYNRVFSSRYPDNLDEVYCDGENGVYALGGSRGMDIFYDYSEVASLDSINGDELYFTVNNHYTGTYESDEPYYESVTFSVVVGDDGIWRAGQFTLPY